MGRPKRTINEPQVVDTVENKEEVSVLHNNDPIKVLLPNGTFRLYALDTHGPHYRTLAEAYRDGQGGRFI